MIGLRKADSHPKKGRDRAAGMGSNKTAEQARHALLASEELGMERQFLVPNSHDDGYGL